MSAAAAPGDGRGRGRGAPRRRCEAVHGVLLLDKPAGMTSNEALQRAKRLLNACKAGHTGSLDPIATGVLPLTFGEATKISQFLLNADKRYLAELKLGESTTTYDAEGEVTQRRDVKVTRAAIEHALEHFRGEISQLPPMYSAIKRGGTPLYELAREGVEVEREPRQVVIHELRLVEWSGERLVLEIHCSKGTYVRTLAHDLGELLGCGAHVTALRRLAVSDMEAAATTSLAQLEGLATPQERRECLIRMDKVLGFLPEVHLTRLAAHYLRQGQAVSAPHRHTPGWVRLYDEEGVFLGMGEVEDDGRVAPRRLLALPGPVAPDGTI